MSVRVFAPAKINLTLQVGRPRDDGMHPLQSVTTFANVGDWVEARPADTLSLSVSGPFAAGLGGDDNLVLRAARALAADVGRAPHAALSLEKNLPVASGIGGGSSDAAATLKALNQLWSLGLAEAGLTPIARQLGADVPVCVTAWPAWMTGDGEHVAPMQAPALHGVLINPLTPLPTAEVFRAFDQMQLGGAFEPSAPPAWPDAEAAFAGIATLGNDLTAPARALCPALAHVEGAVADDPRVRAVTLSGSGATVVALTNDESSAAELARELATREREWWIAPVLLGGA
ncbi:MAG: 4-(cytidine 5'-diphospho)-2-C-methyl-D-erythritol kinase [Hyphomonadaceae bacterium]